MKVALLAVIVSVSGLIGEVHAGRLQEKYIWKQLRFAWPSIDAELDAIASGRYIPENNMPCGMELWRDKVFITVPRLKSGVGASLTYLQLPTDERSPILNPYPNWEAHNIDAASAIEVRKRSTTCHDDADAVTMQRSQNIANRIVSPYRVRADECDRLWIMDSGLDNVASKNQTKVTDPTIIIFDLLTDQAIHRYSFPDDQIVKSSSFPYITIDITDGGCNNAFAYVTDVTGFGLIVYSLKENKSWRITHNFFHFDPLDGSFYSRGLHYDLPDGIFATVLGNQKPDKSKDLYFHALSSTDEFVVSNRAIQNQSAILGQGAYYYFQLLGDRGNNGQSSAEIFHKNSGIIFYSQINKDAVGCWDSRKPYNPETQGLIDSDSETLVFVNEFFIDSQDNIWVLSNRLANFLFSKEGLNATEDNFRILGGRISDLIIGTPCDPYDASYYLQQEYYWK